MKNVKGNQNRLHPDNCNKAQCKTCIFGPSPVQLSPERSAEIHQYLAAGESSHICHTTGKTCYGSLHFQAKIFHASGIIPEPTVESLLATAAKFLKFEDQQPPLSEAQDPERGIRRGRR